MVVVEEGVEVPALESSGLWTAWQTCEARLLINNPDGGWCGADNNLSGGVLAGGFEPPAALLSVVPDGRPWLRRS